MLTCPGFAQCSFLEANVEVEAVQESKSACSEYNFSKTAAKIQVLRVVEVGVA